MDLQPDNFNERTINTKRRNDFVTNSSSSSFLIDKRKLTRKQIEAIRKHSELGSKLKLKWAEDAWDIDETENFISGYTTLDNFWISDLFDIISVSAYVMWNTGIDVYDAEANIGSVQPDGCPAGWEELLDEIED